MNKLYRITGFIPFISMIFLNASVDLGHKIVIQNTIFKIYNGSEQVILTAIVNGLILLPFIMLFTPAGFLADRFKKPHIMQWAAFNAVLITLIITLSYYMGWFQLAFAMTFILAVQSAFYSPAKYGYIREIAGKTRLTTANGVVQATTIVAILGSMFLFSVLFENALSERNYSSEKDIIQIIAPLAWLLVAGSLMELYFAFKVPHLGTDSTHRSFNWRRYRTGKTLNYNLGLLRRDQVIWLSIIGLSVFWGVSQVVLATFPAFAKENLAISNTIIIQGLLACSGIGIVTGSLLVGKISNKYIETGLIPLGALGMVITLFLLPQISSTPLLALNILTFGFFGGLFIVPLNALIQFHARAEQLGTVLAGNNWIQNIVMLSFLCLTVAFSFLGSTSTLLLYLLTLVTLIMAIYTVWKLPQSLLIYVARLVFAGTHRIDVQGFGNIPSQGAMLLLGNHISWLDWIIVQLACPRPIHFVMINSLYQKWYLKWFFKLFGTIPISSSSSRAALEEVNKFLMQGEVVCLFPEGSISRNGQLGEFKKGFERSVIDVDGVILPFYLRGLWGSRFSRSSEQLKTLRNSGMRRDVIVAFGLPLAITSDASQVKTAVFDLSIDTWQSYTETLDPLPLAWINRAKQSGRSPCITDVRGETTLSRRQALVRALLLSRSIKKQCPEQNIGLLLPTSSIGLLVNMASLISGKTIVNLSYTTNDTTISTLVEKAHIKTIYTSRRLIAKLAKKGIDLTVLFERVTAVYIEDIQTSTGKADILLVMLATVFLPAHWLQNMFGNSVHIHQTAAILFTSGSEGIPKGIVLTHQNIMGNIKQVSDVMDSREDDVIFACLPLFHAFGLTVTGLLPLVEGIHVVCHPEPSDVLTISKAINQHQVTIFFAIATYLQLFTHNHRIHPLMLQSLRIIVAGAEPLSTEIRDNFTIKFGKEIYEGYGTTETTPVATVNIPDRIDQSDWHVQVGNKTGTVGLPLPGSSLRIVDPDTLKAMTTSEDGLILIGGTQVMQGYLDDPEETAAVFVEIDGRRWYRSGDKGHLDADGFLTIVDRYSRYARIGGEMVSLSAVENSIKQILPESTEVMAIQLADGTKDEKIVLLYSGDITEALLSELINTADLKPSMMPSQLIAIDKIPKLANGKNDFNQAKQIAVTQSD